MDAAPCEMVYPVNESVLRDVPVCPFFLRLMVLFLHAIPVPDSLCMYSSTISSLCTLLAGQRRLNTPPTTRIP